MRQIILVSMFLVSSGFVYAQTSVDSIAPPKLKLDLPVFDFPYQRDAVKTVGKGFFGGYANPSMSQSLALTSDVYSGFHYGMKVMSDHLRRSKTAKAAIYANVFATMLGDYLLSYAPAGGGWLHEEFHRAVMTRYHTHSFNDMNTFPIGAETVSVSRVKDEDLAHFKAASPADFARMSAAGIEGEYMLISKLQRNNFFYNQKLFHEFQYWFSTINSIMYVWTCSDPDTDKDIDEMNKQEADISKRDFTGMDMISWAYDLFHPNEAYSARGDHPSGTGGINRYRKTTDLQPNELDYLKKQGWWQLVNVLSPMMFFLRSIELGHGFSGNFAFRHILTSFGTDLSLEVYLKKSQYNAVFAYHHYRNYEHTFPALEAELVDLPVSVGRLNVFLSPRVMAGIQPDGQNFMTANAAFLGLAGCRADFRFSEKWLPYLEVVAKTDGWVAGNEFLQSNISVRVGMSARF